MTAPNLLFPTLRRLLVVISMGAHIYAADAGGPEKENKAPGGSRMHYDPETKDCYNADELKITDGMQKTLTLVEMLSSERLIDRKRVYIIGQSRGGFWACDAMIRRPDLRAAGAPVCGTGDPGKTESINAIPNRACHRDIDTMLTLAGSRHMIEALRKAVAEPVHAEIPRRGHAARAAAFVDPKIHEWLFSQRKL